MAKLFEHEKDCVEFLGEPFTNVHEYLDQYAEKYPVTVFDDQHRKYLHNEKGLDEIGKLWGDKAQEAGAIHIIRDLIGYVPKTFHVGKYHYAYGKSEKWNFVKDGLPKPGSQIIVSDGNTEIEITYLKNVGLVPEIIKWRYK